MKQIQRAARSFLRRKRIWCKQARLHFQPSLVWLTCITSFHSEGFQDQCQSRWFSNSFYFHYLGKISNLYIIFFKWVETTNILHRPQSFGCMWRSGGGSWQFSLLGDVMEMLQSSVKSLKKMMNPQICIGTEIFHSDSIELASVSAIARRFQEWTIAPFQPAMT